ncbi:MAG: GNAT family N-acetyltransferase [Deltaproteobacteria bacterium]|nr:GNAT family N-acetyltransferase [Deltaproteobacteria bacterium]
MINVRPMEDADQDRVLDLWERLMAAGAEVDRRWVPAPNGRDIMIGWSRMWMQRAPFPHGFVAEEGEALLGFIAGAPLGPMPVLNTPPSARISDLFVVDDRRREGIGSALFSAFREAAEGAGFPSLVVSTLFIDERSGTFWTRQGFLPEHVVLRRPVTP